MARSDRHIRTNTYSVGIALTLAVLAVWLLGWVEGAETGLYDLRAQRFQQFTPKPTDKIVHVDIDDASLEAMGAWPWPRSQMAELIDEMSLAGVKVIALDVLYTEPQETQYAPNLDGNTFTSIDHDTNLAASLKRAGNVLLPASLSFVSARSQSPAATQALALLTADPSMSVGELVAALQQKGIAATDLGDVETTFYSLRREAVQRRIELELAKGPTALPATLPTQPSTATSQPATQLAAAGPPDEQAIKQRLLRQLFPNVDPHLVSPQSRLIDENYNRVLASKALTRFTRPAVAGVTPFMPRSELLPVRELITAADSSAFVDYPNFTDGTVRSVPLFVQHNGRLLPQFGLRVACKMLDVDPADLVITPDAVTIPAGTLANGTPRPQLRIPVREHGVTFQSGRSIEYPLLMEIPWFGPRRWWAMYDPNRPDQKAQHVSLSVIYDVANTARRLRQNAIGLDLAARDLLKIVEAAAPGTPSLLKEYEARKIAGVNFGADADTAAWVLKAAEPLGITADMSVNDPENSETDRKAIAATKALSVGPAELPKLQAQLNQQRAELKRSLSGKAGIIGWTAVASIADQKPTSLHAAAPGVVVHGVIVNALLTGDVWRTAPVWINAALLLALGLLTTGAVARLSPVTSLITAVLLAAGFFFLNCWLLFDYGNWIVELAAPLLAVAAPWAGGTITRLVIETREKLRITRRLGSYVDPDLVNYVLESKDETIFTGQRRETTVVFTDLEGFTKLSDQLKEAVVPVLNDFMGRATRVIKKHNGFVNKFLGDGILFFFNAPRPNQSFAADAVDSILDLQVMMRQFNAELAERNLPLQRLRAGITTGNVIAGDAGSKERADYTVLGDMVNLAARLESANKAFGTLNLVSESTVRGAGTEKFLFRPIGVIQVVGLEAGVMVYETLAWAHDTTDELKKLAALTTAVYDAFAAGNAAACLEAIKAYEEVYGPSKYTKVYRSMCEPYVNGSASGEMPKQIVLSEK